MAGKRVEFCEEARLECEAAFEWCLERSHSVATRFAGEIERAVEAIVEAPQRVADS
jgi:hypothetical protein